MRECALNTLRSAIFASTGMPFPFQNVILAHKEILDEFHGANSPQIRTNRHVQRSRLTWNTVDRMWAARHHTGAFSSLTRRWRYLISTLFHQQIRIVWEWSIGGGNIPNSSIEHIQYFFVSTWIINTHSSDTMNSDEHVCQSRISLSDKQHTDTHTFIHEKTKTLKDLANIFHL